MAAILSEPQCINMWKSLSAQSNPIPADETKQVHVN